jgi:uncharacterized protein with von Willebrand factor type A (vWA) domain
MVLQEIVKYRDYTVIIDGSGSMSTRDQRGGRSRWVEAQESTEALARKCEELDPDGITVYVFGSLFKRFDNVTSGKVTQIFQEKDPSGGTNLAGVLQDAISNYFQRKAAHHTKPNGETILVVTDGEPDDPEAVKKVIIDASCRIDRDEELAISFIQVGTDPSATKFLKQLDDELQRIGAKFDICDTITMHEMENMTLFDVLLKAITD